LIEWQKICNFKVVVSAAGARQFCHVSMKTNSSPSRSTSASQQPEIDTLPCLRDTGVTRELTLWYTAAKLRYVQSLTLYLKLMFPVYCLRQQELLCTLLP